LAQRQQLIVFDGALKGGKGEGSLGNDRGLRTGDLRLIEKSQGDLHDKRREKELSTLHRIRVGMSIHRKLVGTSNRPRGLKFFKEGGERETQKVSSTRRSPAKTTK